MAGSAAFQRTMATGQGAHRTVATCLDEGILGLYFLSAVHAHQLAIVAVKLQRFDLVLAYPQSWPVIHNLDHDPGRISLAAKNLGLKPQYQGPQAAIMLGDQVAGFREWVRFLRWQGVDIEDESIAGYRDRGIPLKTGARGNAKLYSGIILP